MMLLKTGRIPDVRVKTCMGHNMKTRIIACIIFISTQLCASGQDRHPNLEEILERSFASFEAVTNGCFVTFRTNVFRHRITYEPGDSRDRWSVPGERFFFSYGEKIDFGQRDSRLRFEPLKDVLETGFSVRFTAFNQWKRKHYESRGDLLFLGKTPDDDKQYEIQNEEFLINDEIVSTTNEVGTGVQTSLDSRSVIAEEGAGITEKLAPKTNATVVQADNISAEPASQTAETTASSPWKLVFPIIGILFAGLFVFFRLKKR